MRLRFRMPTYVVAAALLGLIAVLATLQYRWLGQISTAERERMKASLASRTNALAQDFDREITRAYLTFQIDPLRDASTLAATLGERVDRWHATSRFPRLIKDVLVMDAAGDAASLQRYDTATRSLQPVEWPAALEPVRSQLANTEPEARGRAVVMRGMRTMWESIPALVVPAPLIFVSQGEAMQRHGLASTVRFAPGVRFTILVLDKEYIAGALLPSLVHEHLADGSGGPNYQIAVLGGDNAAIYANTAQFTGQGEAAADAVAEMFQVRLQQFGPMVSEVRRFATFAANVREREDGPGGSRTVTIRESAPMAPPQRWQLKVKHPSGSLEAAVSKARRRNLLVSSGILAVLGISIGVLVVSTRRAQDLARQQMEFVAAVSHELRTPLAVIRSAADNLADGVVKDGPQVRQYGELVRREGRRLSEMVEQILELAGIHAGQRGFALRPVAVLPLLHDVMRASAKLAEDAGLTVQFDAPKTLPPVLGDEQALRRVFQNLVGNAVKYGAGGGWIGVTLRATGSDVQVTIADKGIGIAPAEQAHIFEPFYRAPRVIDAQIQGAGLGLSLVHRIVAAHGGRISVRSAPGAGSEFTVHLPAAFEAPAARTTSAGDPAPTLNRA